MICNKNAPKNCKKKIDRIVSVRELGRFRRFRGVRGGRRFRNFRRFRRFRGFGGFGGFGGVGGFREYRNFRSFRSFRSLRSFRGFRNLSQAGTLALPDHPQAGTLALPVDALQRGCAPAWNTTNDWNRSPLLTTTERLESFATKGHAASGDACAPGLVDAGGEIEGGGGLREFFATDKKSVESIGDVSAMLQ